MSLAGIQHLGPPKLPKSTPKPLLNCQKPERKGAESERGGVGFPPLIAVCVHPCCDRKMCSWRRKPEATLTRPTFGMIRPRLVDHGVPGDDALVSTHCGKVPFGQMRRVMQAAARAIEALVGHVPLSMRTDVAVDRECGLVVLSEIEGGLDYAIFPQQARRVYPAPCPGGPHTRPQRRADLAAPLPKGTRAPARVRECARRLSLPPTTTHHHTHTPARGACGRCVHAT